MREPPAMTAASALFHARLDLACALRWAARYGLHEGVCNHFSLRLPGEPERFLINPQGLHWSEITAGDLLVVTADGQILEGRYAVEPTAICIHAAIHRALREYATRHLPQYERDDGPLSAADLRAIRRRVGTTARGRVVSNLFD